MRREVVSNAAAIFQPWVLCALVLCLSLSLYLSPAAQAQEPDRELEQEAQAIDKMIMCPVCPAETIDQAQVEVSFQMRALVREMLAEGRTRQEILDYFADRYGDDILAAPPKSGRNLLVWFLPVVGVAGGLVGVYLVIRAMTGRQRPVMATATPAVEAYFGYDPEMAPYMEIADRMVDSRLRSLRPSAAAAPPATGADAGAGRPSATGREGEQADG